MKPNNLKEYKRKQQEINTKLVKRAIDHIIKIGGNLSINNVSRTTYEIANSGKGEKGLTPAAISKNKLYKNMILKAKAQKNKQKIDSPSLMTLGDLQMQLFQERQKNQELKIKIKVLEDKLSQVALIEKQSVNSISLEKDCLEIKEENKQLKSLLKGIINTLVKLELIENVNGDFVIPMYRNVLLKKEHLEIIEF
jgi:hypothetical protein